MDLSVTLCVFSLLLIGYSCAQTIRIKGFKDGQELERQTNSAGITFRCIAEGIGDEVQPNLQWIGPADQPIVVKPNSHIRILEFTNEVMLIFDTLKKRDAGNYRCEGTINGIVQKYEIKLELYDGIQVDSDPNQSPTIHTTALIACRVTNGAAEVRWLFPDNKPIRGPRYRQTPEGLEIKNITEDDNGSYICLIIVSGTSVTYHINVTVTVPTSMTSSPTITSTIVGKRFEMTCEASGKPTPKFTFMKNGVLITNQPGRFEISEEPVDPKIPNIMRGKLVIVKLLNTDEGEYSCRAKNDGGEIIENVFVDTKVAPSIRDIRNITAEEKTPVELVCEVEGDPAPVIIWQILDSGITLREDIAAGIEIKQVNDDRDQLIKKATSRLKFSSIKPDNANNYTCIAQNEAGETKKTGKITVQFRPNFAHMPYSSTHGWLNHNTEIVCVTDAEPVAGISWKHGDKVIKESDSWYKYSSEGGFRQTTGTLKVSINVENENTIFGTYTCTATNLHGSAEQTIELIKAVKPGVPKISIRESTPTTIDLLITPPTHEGGQPILDYKIEYFIENKLKGKKTRRASVISLNFTEVLDVETDNVTLLGIETLLGNETLEGNETFLGNDSDPTESRTSYLIDGLEAKTTYIINVQARNNVDYGDVASIHETTLSVRVPEKPEVTSPDMSNDANSYQLTWKTPLSGGKPLTGFNIKYYQVEAEVKDGQLETVKIVGEAVTKQVGKAKTSLTLGQLQPSSHYKLSISAINSIGESKANSMIFKTAAGSAPVINQAGLGTGVVIGVVIAICIIFFIIIDVTFYFTKQCGVLWTIKGKVSSGDAQGERIDTEANDHEKEAFIKGGKQDSEEPSAKDNVEVVNENEVDVKMKELEPEDKDKAADVEPTVEIVEPASSPQVETAVDIPPPLPERAPDVTPQALPDKTPDVTITEPEPEEKDPKA